MAIGPETFLVVSLVMLSSFSKALAVPIAQQAPRSTAAFATMASLRHIPAGSLHVSKPVWWLESRFHFSFADYYKPGNENFGALRVLNDDLVKPQAGFGRHPHRDAEIFSYILDGELSHADSMGNYEALGRGCVQYLSAGSGIAHSEMNDHPSETCRFLQVWITPDRRGHAPQYGSTTYTPADRHNRLLHMLGGTGDVPAWDGIQNKAGGIKLHQDCNVFVSESDGGHKFEISLGGSRQAYLVCMEGSLKVNGKEISKRDAMEMVSPDGADLPVSLQAGDRGSHFLLIEMQQDSTPKF